jgi:hypothetical protein
MKKKFLLVGSVLLLAVMFTLANCDNGSGSDDGAGLTAEENTFKEATLIAYAEDKQEFEEMITVLNQDFTMGLPVNPNTWTDAQWKQWYTFNTENSGYLNIKQDLSAEKRR